MNANLTVYCMVFCTCPSKDMAEKLARTVIEAKLAACTNIVPQITSIYRWQNTIETDSEVQLILKTRQDKLDSLEELVQQHHPYEVPEWLVLPILQGSQAYLDWMDSVL